MRSRWLLLAGLGLFAFSVFAGVNAYRIVPPPRLAVDPLAYDFGTVNQQQALRAEFHLSNPTKASMQIVNVRTNCGCAVAEVPKKLVPPGESTLLGVKFQTGSFRGLVQRHVLVRYLAGHEQQLQTVRLYLKAVVKPEFDVKPNRLHFRLGGPNSKTAVFTPRDNSDFKVSRADSTHPAFDATVTAPVDGSHAWRVGVAFNATKWKDPGRGTAYIHVRTTSPGEPLYALPVEIQP
ncbi:MAG: DUF1573 domain-containing protein [Planctomycetota bacterium]